MFVRGSDNDLWHKWYAGEWSGWESLGSPPGGLATAPAAVAWSSGRIDVFVAGADNQLWHKWYQGAWSGWQPLGGVLAGAPAVASWASGRLDVFVRGSDNQLWHKWYQGGWSGWQPLGGFLNYSPAAVSWGPGRIDVFAAGADRQLWHKSYLSGWSQWQPLGGTLANGPGVASWGSGRLDVFVLGADGDLYHQWYADGWSGFQRALAGPIASGPSAVSWGPGRVDVFVRGADQAVYHTVGDNPIGPTIANLARSQVGQTDGAIYGGSGEWCAMFAAWVYRSAGLPVGTITEAYQIGTWALSSGGNLLPPSAMPQVGDAVLFEPNGSPLSWPGPGLDFSNIVHVNIVVNVNPDGSFTTVGGDEPGPAGIPAVREQGPYSAADAPSWWGQTVYGFAQPPA